MLRRYSASRRSPIQMLAAAISSTTPSISLTRNSGPVNSSNCTMPAPRASPALSQATSRSVFTRRFSCGDIAENSSSYPLRNSEPRITDSAPRARAITGVIGKNRDAIAPTPRPAGSMVTERPTPEAALQRHGDKGLEDERHDLDARVEDREELQQLIVAVLGVGPRLQQVVDDGGAGGAEHHQQRDLARLRRRTECLQRRRRLRPWRAAAALAPIRTVATARRHRPHAATPAAATTCRQWPRPRRARQRGRRRCRRAIRPRRCASIAGAPHADRTAHS